jgi:DNA-binding MarR family transcriptional regulator
MSFSIDRSLGFIANRVALKFRTELERSFAQRGHAITAEQWLVLSRLYEEDGLAQHEIAERTSRDKTNIARILALMEKNQLIERRSDPEDNRARMVYLTPRSLSLKGDLIESAREVLVRAQVGFSEEEIRDVIDKLNQISDNLS